MVEENKSYENNPFKKGKLVIPVSVPSAIEKQVDIEEVIKEAKEEDLDDSLLEIAALNILMSPVLHKKFKTLCVYEGISMKQKVLDFIKKEVKKPAKKIK